MTAAATPAEGKDLVEQGARLVRQGRLRQAATVLADARRALPPEDPLAGYALLQTGNVARYQGDAMAAAESYATAVRLARRAGDLELAVAAQVGAGEAALDAGDAKGAVVAFGVALGLTESSLREAPTVLPLAGLADAHARWAAQRSAAPGGAKAAGLAARALARARTAGDAATLARALLAAGRVGGDPQALAAAVAAARQAPHVPLAVLAALALWRLEPGRIDAGSLRAEAARCGMAGVVAALPG